MGSSDLLTCQLNLAVVFDVVEGDVDSGRLSVENCKFAAIRFPCKGYDAFWKNNNKKNGSASLHR